MHRIVSVPLDPSLAEYIGKKGSSNSITFYNRRAGDDVIVALAPSSIEEKFYAAAETMLVSDLTILSTAALDKLFGEMLIGCSLIGKPVLLTDDNDATRLVENAGLSNYEVVGREKIFDKISGTKRDNETGITRVDIDQCFPVKGIGTVALGIVTRGAVKVHGELCLNSGKIASVRSIQTQDQDVLVGERGARVGLALKGIEADEISKGDVLSGKRLETGDSFSCKVEISRFAKGDIKAGGSYGFVSNFFYTNVKATSVEGGNVAMKLDRPMAIEKGTRFVLLRENAPRIFAAGKIS